MVHECRQVLRKEPYSVLGTKYIQCHPHHHHPARQLSRYSHVTSDESAKATLNTPYRTKAHSCVWVPPQARTEKGRGDRDAGGARPSASSKAPCHHLWNSDPHWAALGLCDNYGLIGTRQQTKGRGPAAVPSAPRFYWLAGPLGSSLAVGIGSRAGSCRDARLPGTGGCHSAETGPGHGTATGLTARGVQASQTQANRRESLLAVEPLRVSRGGYEVRLRLGASWEPAAEIASEAEPWRHQQGAHETAWLTSCAPSPLQAQAGYLRVCA